MKHFTFESMPVWQIAMDIAVLIFEITKTLPRSEDYGLTSQIRRSALSIAANIAEGFGRQTPLDKKRFYQIAIGSLLETKSHYIYGCRVAYFEEQTNVFQLLDSTHYELNKLIKSIKNSLQ